MSLVLASCNTATTTTTTTAFTTPTSAITETTTTKTAVSSTPTAATAVTTTASTGNWWDSLGTPQYGGTMVLRTVYNIANFDEYFSDSQFTIQSAWMERLFANQWTLDPAVYPYRLLYRPDNYVGGQLAASWEFPDPSTFVVHLRQNVYWQNISPANGRQFVASDVVFHYNRFFGLGDGFTKPGTYWATQSTFSTLQSVTATDKYTVVFKWGTPNPEFITENLEAVSSSGQCIESPDAVQQWGNVSDWHHAIGTGPFILQDFVSGSSATMVKNPAYWGSDERYPQNKLPYIDTLKILIIPDNATALAAMRTGKIDAMNYIALQDAQNIKKTNPNILQILTPTNNTPTIDPRDDLKPFNDLRVREAMQMALDLPTIANTYYGGTAIPYPQSYTSSLMTGWGFPYDQWPQDLKDQYAYNPTAAKQLLAAAGYPTGFNTDIVVDAAADQNLLQIVMSYFAAIGINVQPRVMDTASWTAFVLTGHKHDALAFRSSGSAGAQYEPIRQLTRFMTGGYYTMVSDPVFDAFYPKAMAATTVDAIKQVLKDGDEYAAYQHFVVSLVQPNLYSLYQPWLKGYNGQLYGIDGTASGMPMLSFYAARFWIDQNMKKSMGY